jgi:PAS domain S-box-containing protein
MTTRTESRRGEAVGQEARRHNEEERDVELRGHLESLVRQRTRELAEANERLQSEIAEGRRTAEALGRTRAQFERLLMSIPSVLIGVDEEGRVIHWNEPAAEVFGISAAETLWRPFLESGIGWDWQQFLSRVDPAAAGEWLLRFDDVEVNSITGRRSYLTVFVSSLSGAGDAASGYLVFGTDVTERRALEDRLVQAKKLQAVGRLAAGMAHEINTPIQFVDNNLVFAAGSVRSMSEALRAYDRLLQAVRAGTADGALADEVGGVVASCDLEYLLEETPRALTDAQDGTARVAEIVRAMQQSSQDSLVDRSAIDINHLVERTAVVSRHEWQKTASLSTDFDSTLPPVPAAPGELAEAISALLTNAAHAVADAGRSGTGEIRVSTRLAPPFAEIRIEDNGCGIPPGIRERVFDPFFTTRVVGQGTGQGLTVARATVVERHGGSIEFESAVGVGTVFIVRLPIESPQAAATAAD